VTSLQMMTPAGWERAKGFSYGVVAVGGRTVFIAGQLAVIDGAASVTPNMPFADQYIQALRNVVAVAKAAGGDAANITMLRAFVRDMDAFRHSHGAVGAVWRDLFGKHFPAMTVVEVTQLYCPNALVEIEAVAVIG
jgi:enamine deaminase RidA (YjgF/YER057c/UK114 family)